MLPKLIIDFASSQVLALGAASVSAALPAGTELVGISASGNGHFVFGDNAAAAVAADPIVTPGCGMLIVRVPPAITGDTKYFAVIQDGTSTGNVTICRVMEG